MMMPTKYVDTSPPASCPFATTIIEALVTDQNNDFLRLSYACKTLSLTIPRSIFHRRDCDPTIGQIVRMSFQSWSDGETYYRYMNSVEMKQIHSFAASTLT